MPFTIAEEKSQLREQVNRTLSGLTAQQAQRSDRAMFARFLSLPQVEAAQTIFAFWGIPGREPETEHLISALIQRGKRVGLPRMLPHRGMEVRQYNPAQALIPAAFGILQPGEDAPLIAKEAIDLALVPSVCYDRLGYRLGFGGGYYDRWLEHFSGIRVGLCRELVLQERVPTQAHDAKVDVLLTEQHCLDCTLARG